MIYWQCLLFIRSDCTWSGYIDAERCAHHIPSYFLLQAVRDLVGEMQNGRLIRSPCDFSRREYVLSKDIWRIMCWLCLVFRPIESPWFGRVAAKWRTDLASCVGWQNVRDLDICLGVLMLSHHNVSNRMYVSSTDRYRKVYLWGPLLSLTDCKWFHRIMDAEWSIHCVLYFRQWMQNNVPMFSRVICPKLVGV